MRARLFDTGSAARLAVTATAVCCAAAALLGQFGGKSERFDAVNLFLPYILGVGLAAALVAIVRPGLGRWLGVASLVGMAAGPAPLVAREFMTPSLPASRCAGPTLRVIQFNAWKENNSTEAAARWIRASGADLVMLEEAHSRVPLQALLRAAYPYQQSCVGEAACSTTILSRRRPLASGGLAKGDPENRAGLSAAWMRLDTRHGPFTAVVAHLGRPWPFVRFEGDRLILEAFVRTLPRDSTIVAGDFNLPGWTFQLQAIDHAFGIERRTRALLSWPAMVHRWRLPAPLIGIDQLFAGDAWAVEELRRGPFLGSDHYPVIADLRRCTR